MTSEHVVSEMFHTNGAILNLTYRQTDQVQ